MSLPVFIIVASPPLPDHISPTASDLYEHDIANWSEQQADLPRRLARGEQVHGVGWENVAEEIECVGRNEVKAVELLRGVALLRVLKPLHWSDHPANQAWRGEVRWQTSCRRLAADASHQWSDGWTLGRSCTSRGAVRPSSEVPRFKKATVSAVEVRLIEYLLSADTRVDKSIALFEPR